MVSYDYKIDDAEAIRLFNRFKSEKVEAFRTVIVRMMAQIGLAATGDFMTLRTFDNVSGKLGGRKDDRLHSNSSRLERSLKDNLTFNIEGGKVPGAREGHRKIVKQGDNIYGEYGTKVPYAAVHEYGHRMKVTPRQRKYFWWRHSETAALDSIWKRLALTDEINIPARPYLRPAAEQEAPKAAVFMEQELSKLLKKLDPGA